PAAFNSHTFTDFAFEPRLRSQPADVVERAARGVRRGDRCAAAAHGLDALQRGVGAVAVRRVVIAEGDIGDRHAVFLPRPVVLAGAPAAAAGGTPARVHHPAIPDQ